MNRAIYDLLVILVTICTTLGQTNFNYKANDIGELFIEGINTESIERRKEIISLVISKSLVEEKGIDAIVSLFNKLNELYAPLEYHHTDIIKFNKASGTVYVMHIYGKKKGDIMWKDFQLYIDNPPMQKINKLAFIAEVAEPINLPNGAIQQAETLEWLNNYISKLISENDLSGSLLIAQGDNILIENYFGYSDTGKTVLINKNSLFGIASGGKMFTALSIAKLVEEKKINYNDRITKYIDGFADKLKADKITVHHLLSHTSGVAQYWWGQKSESFSKANSINDHLKMVLDAGFKTEPGHEYEYNNSNYILLGAIIEKVTGIDYYTYVTDNIFKKANMKNSGYYNHRARNVVTPLTRSGQDNNWIEAERGSGRGSSAGGAYSNARDILNFSLALRDNKLVHAETFRNMIAVKNNELNTPEDYGYGFIIQKSAQEITYGHGGTAQGVNFEFRYFPNQDITLVVFCNQNNGAYDDLKRNAIKLISGDR